MFTVLHFCQRGRGLPKWLKYKMLKWGGVLQMITVDYIERGAGLNKPPNWLRNTWTAPYRNLIMCFYYNKVNIFLRYSQTVIYSSLYFLPIYVDDIQNKIMFFCSIYIVVSQRSSMYTFCDLHKCLNL